MITFNADKITLKIHFMVLTSDEQIFQCTKIAFLTICILFWYPVFWCILQGQIIYGEKIWKLCTIYIHNPPNHLLVEPRYYHGDGSKITLLQWPWQYHGSSSKKSKYSSKSLELPNSFRNGRKKIYCHCRGTTTATEVM